MNVVADCCLLGDLLYSQTYTVTAGTANLHSDSHRIEDHPSYTPLQPLFSSVLHTASSLPRSPLQLLRVFSPLLYR